MRPVHLGAQARLPARRPSGTTQRMIGTPPGTGTLDAALVTRPGNAETPLDPFLDYRSNVAVDCSSGCA